MSSGEEQALRVELRRFLGGIPFSHERGLTPAERSELRKEAAPYISFGLLFLLLSIGVFAVTLLEATAMGPVMVTVGAALAAVPVSCYFWMRPVLQTLKSGRLSVYLGRMSDIAAFDAVQAHYQGRPEIAVHLHRYVEILAVGNGERIWRFGGIPNHEALAGIRPIWVATVPDHDERGERRLTEEETRELRLRASEFRKIGPFLAQEAMAIFVSLIFYGFTFRASGGFAAWAPFLLWAVMNVGIWVPYLRRRLFARMLRRDAKTGVVSEGWLSSGMPWVVNGEPALWGTGRAAGGTHAVTKAQAIASENASIEARAGQTP